MPWTVQMCIRDSIYTNHAKLTVHGYTEPGTVPGEDDFDKEYEDSASYTLSSVATSSVKTIAYNRHANHKKDPKDDTGSGDRPMPENYVEGMQGEDVTYTLNVKNEATTTTIANMVVIDRLPYVGDIGVIAGYGRGSAFEVSYNGGLVVSADGSTIKGVTAVSYTHLIPHGMGKRFPGLSSEASGEKACDLLWRHECGTSGN